MNSAMHSEGQLIQATAFNAIIYDVPSNRRMARILMDNVVENTQSAESAVRDTDMATQMVTYSNNRILAQTGQAMLARSNQAKQGRRKGIGVLSRFLFEFIQNCIFIDDRRNNSEK